MPKQGNTATEPRKLDLGPPGWACFEAQGLGRLWIAWVAEGLVVIRLDGERPEPAYLQRWLPDGVDPDALFEAPLPGIVRETLTRYFDGEDVDPATLPVRITGTRFQRKAWSALRDVTRGHVRTYAGLAKDIRAPRSMRAIGMAMGANPLPIVVPCHRVVGAGYELGGYSGGLERKRVLLELEGVKIQDGHVLPGQLDLPVT